MKKLLKKYARSIITGVLAFLMLFEAVLPQVSNTAYADSNDLRKAFIQLKNKQSLTDIDKNQLDSQTLRIIALYLSNYYNTFETVLDGDDVGEGEDEEGKAGTEQKMISALENAGFTKDSAEILVASVLKASLSTAKPLVFESNKEEMTKVVGSDAEQQGILTGALTVGTATEALNEARLSLIWDDGGYIKTGRTLEEDTLKVDDGTYRLTYGLFLSMVDNGYKKDFKWLDSDGNKSSTVAFSTNDYCKAAFAMCNARLHFNEGYGGSFSTLDRETATKLDKSEEMFGALAIGAQLYVDWVGNILMDTGLERIVILPACMNPYTFKIVGGNDGSRLNFVSSYGVNNINEGNITRRDNKNADKNGNKYQDSRYQVLGSKSTNNLYGLNYWTAFRGLKGENFDLDGSLKASWGENNILLTLMAWGCEFADEKYVEATGDTDYKGKTDTLNTQDGDGDTVVFPNFFKSTTPIPEKTAKSDKVDIMMTSKDNKGFYGLSQVVYFDTEGVYEGEDKDWEGNIIVNDVATGIGNVKEENDKKKLKSNYATSGISFKDVNKATGDMATEMDKDLSTAIYTTYVYAYSNYIEGGHKTGTAFDKDKHKVNMVFNGDIFPVAADNDIDDGKLEDKLNKAATDKIQSEIMSMIYYILHPVEGMHYFATWAKTKISAFFLGWHEDMVGYTTSNTSTGMTKYIGFTGYTTLPSLADMSWTNWMLENYNSIIVYLIIVMSIIMCCYVIVGSLTGQRALVGVFMFGFLAFLPPVAINMTVDIVNNMCDTMYGTKFTYWALVQHQSYIQELYTATQDAESYKEFVLKGEYSSDMNEEGAESTDANFTSVKLKWMSPKKDNYMASFVQEVQDDMSEKLSDQFLNNLLGSIGGKSQSGEDYLDSPEALFLYRDYMNITKYSLKAYNLYNFYNNGGEVSQNDGDYKLQVGYRWNASNEYSKIGNLKYSSGLPFKNMVYVNYEADGTYNSQLGTDLHDVSSTEAMRKGFLAKTIPDIESGSKDYYGDGSYAINYLLNFPRAYDDIALGREKLENDLSTGKAKIGKDKLWGYGLPQSYFNFTQSDLSQEGKAAENGVQYSKDLLDYYYYGLYSESPFYYMTFNTIDQMKAYSEYTYSLTKSNEVNVGTPEGHFKDMLLGNNLEYFYNYSENSGDGYGELRDFMNMHDFFYYVLPLMDSGNQLVDLYDSAYGMNVYDDVKVTFTKNGNVVVSTAKVDGEDGTTTILSDVYGPRGEVVPAESAASTITYAEATQDWTNERVYKFWHNYNVATIFNAYSTWADTMYDCNYAKPENIKIGGKKYRVDNPLDPTSYFKYDTSTGRMTEGRPMVFSRSEVAYYGLEWSQLTTVEKKIIEVQDSVYEKAIDLMNYYNFDDDVLVSAYAMLQLFEFNKEFSQTSLIGSDYIMYPQSYELKAFTYDAYLRLIVSNTTGDDLQSEQNMSLYERTMKNSSITFGFLLIILDIICVYIIPAFKVFFLVVLFFMSILMIVSSAVKIELNLIKVTWQSLLAPLLSFSAITVGLAFIVSLFMSNGAKGVTGEMTPTVKLGDPTMVVAVMIVLNAIALYMYYKVCKKAFKDFLTYAKAVFNNVAGTVTGAFKTVAGVALAGGVLSAIKNRSTDGGTLPRHDPSRAGEENKPSPRVTGTGGSDIDGGSSNGGGAVQPGDMPMNNAKTVKEQEGVDDKSKNYDNKIASGKSKREGNSDSKVDAKDVALAGGVAVAGSAVAAKLQDADKPKMYNDKANQLERQAKERSKTLAYRREKMSQVSKRDEGQNYGFKVGAAVESANIKKTQLQSKAYRAKAKVAQTGNNVKSSYDNVKTQAQGTYNSAKTKATNTARVAGNKVKKTVSKPVTAAKKKVNKQVKGYNYARYKK